MSWTGTDTKSVRSTIGSVTRRVPPVEDDGVAVRVPDEAHVADAAVLDAHDLRARGASLVDCRADVRDAESHAGDVRREHLAVVLGVPERERHVRRLDLALRHRARNKPKHVTVESGRPRHVARRDRHEVHLLDPHYDCCRGAYRRWSMRSFPS